MIWWMTIPLHRLASRWLRLECARLSCVFAMMIVTAGAAWAQAPSVPTPQVFYSNVTPLSATIARYWTDPRPQSAEGAFQLSNWLLYGGLGLGVACDSNVNSSPTNPQQACGPRFTPSLVAEYNTGIQRTFLYGVGDIRYYPSLGLVDVVNTTAGVVHVWEIQRDLIFRIQAQGLRNEGYSGAANLLNTNLFLTTPLYYTQGYGSTSLQKEFGPFFTAIGGSITGTAYDNIQDNLGNTINETFQNGTVSTLNARFGYHLSPIIYTYVEPSLNWQRYSASDLNSEGYRLVAGIGSDRIGLFSGDVYGGYATQSFEDPTVGTDTVPVFGGHLSWYPTRFLTYKLTLDREFGTSNFLPNGLTPGAPGLVPGALTDTTTARLDGTWDISRRFSFAASVGEQRQDYLNSSRVDNLWAFSAGLLYKIWPNLGVGVNYTYQNLQSNFPGASFTQNFISVQAQWSTWSTY
jgi:hypothetical protein